MKSSLFLRIGIAGVVGWSLIAPFTFNKPKVITPEKLDEPDIAQVKPEVIEQPLHNVVLPKFAEIVDVKKKKAAFFNFLRPSVNQANSEILIERQAIKVMLDKISLEESLSALESELLVTLAKKYRVSRKFSQFQKLNELLLRVDIIPSPLVLVQAANESAWGTSRFARIGLNFFGIWCYQKGCGMVPKSRNEGANHEVAAFNSVNHAVERYLYNINTNSAYTVFRAIRGQLRAQNQPLQAQVLATGLLPYSERGTDYVLEITEMIRHNKAYLNVASAD